MTEDVLGNATSNPFRLGFGVDLRQVKGIGVHDGVVGVGWSAWVLEFRVCRKVLSRTFGPVWDAVSSPLPLDGGG